MPLAAGTRIGPYEVIAPIGAGGMGEVYRARDAHLGRDVALKVLPDAVAADPDRQARFHREAQLLAALGHTNIAQIYGVERADGLVAIAMELVPGPTLAELLANARGSGNPQGVLPVPEALRIARQIADALEAAHDKGIVHRDLKPANIKVTDAGVVKVLDFGLAKALDAPGAPGAEAMNSPTLTARVTELGTILGTAAYMAPEQARGKMVDRRADVWAFGCVLYEMLTGARAFQGDDISDILAAVLRSEPDWRAVPADLPPAVRALVERCLVKDRAQRIADISTARFVLTDPSILALEAGPGATVPARSSRALHPGFVAAALAIAVAGTAVAMHLFAPAATPTGTSRLARLSMTTPDGDVLRDVGLPLLAISPDGTRVVYTAVHEGQTQLFMRALDRPESSPIPGTENGAAPFFSPDGLWVAFFTPGMLKKASLTGNALQVLVPDITGTRGGTWASNDIIYYVPGSRDGVWAVPAAGGAPKEVTRLDAASGEVSHRWPQLLPDGTHMLFTIWTGPGWDEQQVAVQSLQTGERRVLVRGGGTGRYVAPGYLAFARADTLLAQRMDLATLTLTGSAPVTLGEEVLTEGAEGAQYAVSDEGTLVYIGGGAARLDRRIVWVDRKGAVEPLPLPSRHYSELALSPDGRQLALQTEDGTHGLWIYDFARASLTALAITNGSSQAPVWTPDGSHIVYRATRRGTRTLYWKATDGTGDEAPLSTIATGMQTPSSTALDGTVAFSQSGEKTGNDLWLLKPGAGTPPQRLLATASSEWNPHFSPDGKWMAYESMESGRDEIYVMPVPGPGPRHSISTEGGSEPVWSADGHELFYLNRDAMMAVDITLRPAFAASAPRLLYRGLFRPSFTSASAYAISRDGKRFLRIQSIRPDRPLTEIQVVVNWFDELRKQAK